MAATLEYRLTGGAGNADPNASLGGVMSATELSETALNNLFDNVTPEEATAGDTEYRAIDIFNAGDAAATSIEIYISSQSSSPDTSIAIGKDGTNGDPHAAAANLETVANESTAPSSPVVTFVAHLTGNKLALTDIPIGQACRIWVRRVVSEGASNTSNDTATLAVQYA